MKKIIFIFTLCFMFCSTHLYAARFGGGKSFGHNSSSHSSNRSSPSNNPQHSQPQSQPHNNPPPKSSFASKILPALAGLSIGAMLGSMLGGHGLGGGLGMIFMGLIVCAIVFYALKHLLSRGKPKNFNHFQNTAVQTDTGYTVPVVNPVNSYSEPNRTYSDSNRAYSDANQSSHSYNNTYESFNKEEFLRTAKITFIRMQTAYDNKNLTDIRTFTTPEVFAEVQMQIHERGDRANQTEVVNIHAILLDEYQTHNTAASVLFTGQVREQVGASPVNINEIWHFVRQQYNSNEWLISGIEQKS